jgi:uncharacterized RDD family membrane protein YckC
MNVNVVGRRILAFVVDSCIVTVVFSVAAGAIDLPESLDSLGLIFGFFVYKIVGEALLGVTLGKRFLNVRVVDLSGRAIGWIPAIIRNLMLIPGAFLLFIPSLAMMENSPTKQRLGDRIAGTIVVRRRNGAIATKPQSRFDPMTGQPIVPGVQVGFPVAVATPRLRFEDWRLVVAGSLALGAATILATTIVTIDLAICSQTNARSCAGDFGSPVWPGSGSAHALAIISATLALVAVPLCIGFVARRWVWIPISGCVWGVTFVIAVILGYWITSSYYSDYYSESADNAGAVIAYFFFLIIGMPVPAIFALLGTLGGIGIGRLRR